MTFNLIKHIIDTNDKSAVERLDFKEYAICMAERKEYKTKTRVQILDFIRDNHSNTISVSDIMDYLKSIGSTVNQTTVYRYLEKLCDEHIVVKYPDKSGKKSVYQFIDKQNDCANHLHLKCTQCGKLVHMDCSFIDKLSKHLKKNHNFVIQYKGNILYGICKDCQKKNSKKK